MAIDPRFFEQARTFINETMKSVVVDANVDGGSGINAVLGRGGATISASLLQEIEHIITTRDLTDPDALLESDMDLILENLLTSRDGGNLSFGFVRLFYPDRQRREFQTGLTATIESKEINFLTLASLVFEPQDYFLESSSNEFYINVPFTAEEAGEVYNIDVGEINQLTNDNSGVTRVTNIAAFRNGKEKQTNAQALRKAQRAVSTRTPMSRDGAISFMQDLFSAKIQDLVVVGNGDNEMLRDEVFDLGVSSIPRFQIGVDSLDQVTREQLGSGQQLHVGGRTDIYSIFDTINYVQKHIDLFADMSLDTDIPTPVAEVQATFIVGTTGVVAASGKLIIDLGGSGEETVAYSSRVTADGNTYTFTLSGQTAQIHASGATVKVVNNNELSIGENGDITVLPVFQISDIRLLDPITFQPVGEPVQESNADSNIPGWYIGKSNRYDILSARETKSLFIDEKRDVIGNQPKSGTAGVTSDTTLGGASHTKYTEAGSNFTGYQGREITLSGTVTVTRTIIQVLSATEIVLSGGLLLATTGVDFTIAAGYEDYNEFPIRVSYYTNTELQEAQSFLDQSAKRILSSEVLSRSFMPVFLDFVMEYKGDGEPLDIRERVNTVFQTSAGDAIGESSGAKFEYSDLINAAYVDGLANYVSTPFEIRVRRLQVDGSFKIDYVHPGPNTVNELAIKTDPGIVRESDGSYTDATSTFITAGAHFVIGDVGKSIWISGFGVVGITGFNSSSSIDLDITFTTTIVSGVEWSRPVFFLEAKRPVSIPEFIIPSEGRLYLGGFTDNTESVEYSSVDIVDDEYTFVLKDGQSIIFPHTQNEALKISVLDYVEENVITNGVITDERIYRPFFGNSSFKKLT